MNTIKIKTGKATSYLYLYIDVENKITDKTKFIDHLVKNVKKTFVGYAGYKNKEALKKFLIWEVFGYDSKITKFKLNINEVKNIIRDSIKRCNEEIPSKSMYLFIFPTFDSFVINKMSGVGGYFPWKNTIILSINPTGNWKKALKHTVCHEFNHSVMSNYNKWETLLDFFIYEGLAEHFREHVCDGGTAPWAKAISLKQCKNIFSKLKNLLNSKSDKLYSSVFFGNNEYKPWTGYAIGYQIIKSFLKNNSNMKWSEIVKLRPKKILKMSDF